jgi:hypothetical protein
MISQIKSFPSLVLTSARRSSATKNSRGRKANRPARKVVETGTGALQTASGASVSALHSGSNHLVVQPARAVGRTIRNIFVAAVIILALLLAIVIELPGNSLAPPSDKSAVSVPLSDKSGVSDGCGSRGGPGYRLASGKCASWNDQRTLLRRPLLFRVPNNSGSAATMFLVAYGVTPFLAQMGRSCYGQWAHDCPQ